MTKKSKTREKGRTALLIYCTPAEAELVREFAKRERRTITGFVMSAVMNRLAVLARMYNEVEKNREHDTIERTRS
jgi:uncharacterized protein (DUF1778 family)